MMREDAHCHRIPVRRNYHSLARNKFRGHVVNLCRILSLQILPICFSLREARSIRSLFSFIVHRLLLSFGRNRLRFGSQNGGCHSFQRSRFHREEGMKVQSSEVELSPLSNCWVPSRDKTKTNKLGPVFQLSIASWHLVGVI